MGQHLKFKTYDYASFGGYIMYAACTMVIPVCLLKMSSSLEFGLTARNTERMPSGVSGILTAWKLLSTTTPIFTTVLFLLPGFGTVFKWPSITPCSVPSLSAGCVSSVLKEP